MTLHDPASTTPALILGFNGATLRELRSRLNVAMVISDDESADVQWEALQYLRLDIGPPLLTKQREDCLRYAESFFLEFSDIYSRRFRYVSEPVSEFRHAFVMTFDFCYRAIQERGIGLLVFSNIPHEGYDYIFYLIGRFLNLKIVMCYQSLFANRFFVSSDIDDFGLFAQNPKLFDSEPCDYKLPTEWFYMKPFEDQSYRFGAMIREIARSPRGAHVALMRYYYASKYRANLAAAESAPKPGERYVYFPLHLQPELTTSALGGPFADQLTALEALSAMAPDGYMIYVKDNPRQTEMQRGPLFFSRINRLKNVRLVGRDVNSVQLIKGSEGVAIITGTAGWEALFHGKPVLTFGRAWYNRFSGVTIYKPETTFEEFLKNGPPPPDKLSKELDALLMLAGRGVVDPEYGSLLDQPRDDNAITVGDSIRRYLDLRHEKNGTPS